MLNWCTTTLVVHGSPHAAAPLRAAALLETIDRACAIPADAPTDPRDLPSWVRWALTH